MNDDLRAKTRFGSDGLYRVQEVRGGWVCADVMFGCDNVHASVDEWCIFFSGNGGRLLEIVERDICNWDLCLIWFFG